MSENKCPVQIVANGETELAIELSDESINLLIKKAKALAKAENKSKLWVITKKGG